MFEQPPFSRKHEMNEVKTFIEQQNNAFDYGSTTKLSHSQSPAPCHGVNLRICQSSFML
jgi:hypothetical protein